MITLQEFGATRKAKADVGEAVDSDRIGPGFVYLGKLYIELADAGFMLTLGNEQWMHFDLPALEATLYHWACGEGYCSRLTPRAQTILDNVLNAMQDAEEIRGPDDYGQLMEAIQNEAATRRANYRG